MRQFSILLFATLMLGGCVMFNDAEVTYSRNTTVGQELLDLQAAKEKGAIDDAEYAAARKSILAGGPFPKDNDDDDD